MYGKLADKGKSYDWLDHWHKHPFSSQPNVPLSFSKRYKYFPEVYNFIYSHSPPNHVAYTSSHLFDFYHFEVADENSVADNSVIQCPTPIPIGREINLSDSKVNCPIFWKILYFTVVALIFYHFL
jgi:hypothetical protein